VCSSGRDHRGSQQPVDRFRVRFYSVVKAVGVSSALTPPNWLLEIGFISYLPL
jgi:hypothetical protein